MKKESLVLWWYVSHVLPDADGCRFAVLSNDHTVVYEHYSPQSGHVFRWDCDGVDYAGNPIPSIQVRHPSLKRAVGLAEHAGIFDYACPEFPVFWGGESADELLASVFGEFDQVARRAMWVVEHDPEDRTDEENATVVFESPGSQALTHLMVNGN